MWRVIFIFGSLLSGVASPATAERAMVFGTWGTTAQCNGSPVLPGGSKLAEPFEITEGWLRQGDLWCLLSWFDAKQATTGIRYFGARAICGEDSVQNFGLGFSLKNDALTLIWNEQHVTGPLSRCSIE